MSSCCAQHCGPRSRARLLSHQPPSTPVPARLQVLTPALGGQVGAERGRVCMHVCVCMWVRVCVCVCARACYPRCLPTFHIPCPAPVSPDPTSIISGFSFFPLAAQTHTPNPPHNDPYAPPPPHACMHAHKHMRVQTHTHTHIHMPNAPPRTPQRGAGGGGACAA